MEYKESKKAYEEVLEVISKYGDALVFDYKDLKNKSEYHLFGLELKEKYGLDIDPKEVYSLDYQKFGEYKVIGRFGEKYRRTVSWSDDGKQPEVEGEMLFSLCFPTGGYIFGGTIFGNDYPTEIFQEFWLELKSYNPKYSDTVNHCLYFSLENAAPLFNSFSEIKKKYHEKNVVDAKKRKIEKLKKEIETLS